MNTSQRGSFFGSVSLLVFLALSVALVEACASIGGGSVSPGGSTPPDETAVVVGDRRVRITFIPEETAATGALVVDDGTTVAGVIEQPGRMRFDVPASAPYDFGAWITVSAANHTDARVRHLLTRDGDQETAQAAILNRTRLARAGVVGLAGRTFADETGPYLGVGVTCFWCPWAIQHDRARLLDNLACLSGQSPASNCPKPGAVDYVRVLVVVGPSGGWEDRLGDARDPGVYARLAEFADLAFGTYGLRVEVTIFGGVDTAPTAAAREAVVRSVAAVVAARPWAVQFVEPANEGNLNGFPDDAGKAELWRLAGILRASTPNLVALTSPQGENAADWYRGSPANIATAHLERDVNGTGGVWRPVRQAREWADFPTAWTSNEPIGPQSSVAADDDPTRLVMSAVMTWLCNGAGYVYHTGAGIRGGGQADRNRGRAANFVEVAHFAETLNAIAAMRAALPADLPNYTFQNGNSRYPSYPFETPYDDNGTKIVAAEEDMLRAFAALAGDRFVAAPIRVQRAVRFIARRPMTFDVLDPLTGQALESVQLAAGQAYTLTPRAAAVFVGRFQ